MKKTLILPVHLFKKMICKLCFHKKKSAFVCLLVFLSPLCLSNQALSGFCGFMAANLYARSIFGEDALANVSIEKPIHLGPDAPVNGHIRIRAKSQVGLYCCIDTFNKVEFSKVYKLLFFLWLLGMHLQSLL